MHTCTISTLSQCTHATAWALNAHCMPRPTAEARSHPYSCGACAVAVLRIARAAAILSTKKGGKCGHSLQKGRERKQAQGEGLNSTTHAIWQQHKH